MEQVNVNSIENILTQLKEFVAGETVMGKPYTTGSTTIIPIHAIKLGFGSGGKVKRNGGGGGAVVTPVGLILIRDGSVTVKTLQPSNIDGILNKLPKILDKLLVFLVKLPKILEKLHKINPKKQPDEK